MTVCLADNGKLKKRLVLSGLKQTTNLIDIQIKDTDVFVVRMTRLFLVSLVERWL